MMAWIEARVWQLAAIAAATLVVILSIVLIVSGLNLKRVERERDQLHDAIHNEATGYIVRLNTCQGNVSALEISIGDQNAKIMKLQEQTAARVSAAEAAVEAARTETQAATNRLNRFLSQAPQGATVCERVDDVDRRFLELLK